VTTAARRIDSAVDVDLCGDQRNGASSISALPLRSRDSATIATTAAAAQRGWKSEQRISSAPVQTGHRYRVTAVATPGSKATAVSAAATSDRSAKGRRGECAPARWICTGAAERNTSTIAADVDDARNFWSLCWLHGAEVSVSMSTTTASAHVCGPVGTSDEKSKQT
jgi:hypothetical protein